MDGAQAVSYAGSGVILIFAIWGTVWIRYEFIQFEKAVVKQRARAKSLVAMIEPSPLQKFLWPEDVAFLVTHGWDPPAMIKLQTLERAEQINARLKQLAGGPYVEHEPFVDRYSSYLLNWQHQAKLDGHQEDVK